MGAYMAREAGGPDALRGAHAPSLGSPGAALEPGSPLHELPSRNAHPGRPLRTAGHIRTLFRMSARDDVRAPSGPQVVRLEERATPENLRRRRQAARVRRRAQIRRRRIGAATLTGGAKAPSAETEDDWRDLAYDIAAKWPGLQTQDGWYRDYIYGGGRSYCYQPVCRANLGNA